MSDDYARVLNVIGLAFNLIGVLILFRWGMPFRVATGGVGFIALEGKDETAAALDKIYIVCGLAGLILLILGVALQIVATLLPPTPLPPKG
jgi:hypothetical protein